MSIELVLAISLTIGVSAMCSTLEAMILSVTTAEIESLKLSSPRKGAMLSKFRHELEETSSAILSLNTIANTLGATLVGGIAEKSLGGGGNNLLVFAIGMTIGILLFSEILPKNLAVSYRSDFLDKLVYPLWMVRVLMAPCSKVCKATVQAVVPLKEKKDESDEEEIILLAQKGAKDGTISREEKDWVTNALALDNVKVREIMTPRTVMFALDQAFTVEQTFKKNPNIPFARIPIFKESIDHVIGIIRRRDLHNSLVEENQNLKLSEIAMDPTFIPENVSADKALRLLLNEHIQLCIVVDEFGSVVGVLAMEDIIETILGQEIFEHDDVAVNMRELAKRKHGERMHGDKSTIDS